MAMTATVTDATCPSGRYFSGLQCNGYGLTAIPSSECPSDRDLAACDTSGGAGSLCEGDGECGTDDRGGTQQ